MKKPRKQRKMTAYDRTMLRQEATRCKVCFRGFGPGAVPHVDHCHETGYVRGVLCRQCNVAFGLLRESPETIQRLVEYAERALFIKAHPSEFTHLPNVNFWLGEQV